MMQETSLSSALACNYVVFYYAAGTGRTDARPVGIGLACPDTRSVWLRFIQPDEGVPGLRSREHRDFIQTAATHVRNWVESGEVPYGHRDLVTGSTEWWALVRDLLLHRLRASEPRPIECFDPEEDAENLYLALVDPRVSADRRRTRLDGALSRALGEYSSRLDRNPALPGFAGEEVRVKRGKATPGGWLVVEAVNLSSPDRAETEADAIASKLSRVRRGDLVPLADLIVGYLTSPGGLNGETHLVQWIETLAEAKTFDLVAERDGFREAVRDSLAAEAEQLHLLDVR